MNAAGRVVASVLTLYITASAGEAATCANRNQVVSRLQSMFGESLIANAVSPTDKAVLEVYSSPNAATWSILVTLPNRNLACLAATGKGSADLEAAVHIQPETVIAQR